MTESDRIIPHRILPGKPTDIPLQTSWTIVILHHAASNREPGPIWLLAIAAAISRWVRVRSATLFRDTR